MPETPDKPNLPIPPLKPVELTQSIIITVGQPVMFGASVSLTPKAPTGSAPPPKKPEEEIPGPTRRAKPNQDEVLARQAKALEDRKNERDARKAKQKAEADERKRQREEKEQEKTKREETFQEPSASATEGTSSAAPPKPSGPSPEDIARARDTRKPELDKGVRDILHKLGKMEQPEAKAIVTAVETLRDALDVRSPERIRLAAEDEAERSRLYAQAALHKDLAKTLLSEETVLKAVSAAKLSLDDKGKKKIAPRKSIGPSTNPDTNRVLLNRGDAQAFLQTLGDEITPLVIVAQEKGRGAGHDGV